MSNGDWMFCVLVSLVIGLLIGSYITEKAIGWKKSERLKELREKTELYEYWRGRAEHFESMMHSAQRCAESERAETKEYRTRWADELQKRLDLADKLEKYTGGTPTMGRGESSADYPCD